MEAKSYRAGAGQIQYLSHDRPDLALASVILANRMSNPTQSDMRLLHQVAAYVAQVPAVSMCFPIGGERPHDGVQLYTDSDWATCMTSRRSRSGGVVYYRGRTVQTYCRTQDTVALSSGEAELKATCKGFVEALGVRHLAEFLNGSPCPFEHLTDAQANLGILRRTGSARLKHLEVRQLWVQEVVNRPLTSTGKVPRHLNPADCLCSPQSAETMAQHMSRMLFTYPPRPEGGRRGLLP